MTLAALLALAPAILDLLKKHWRILLEILLLCWIVFCLLFHFGGTELPQDAQVIKSDTVFIYVDRLVEVNAPRIPTPTITPARLLPIPFKPSGGISADILLSMLNECDSLRWAETATRTYADQFATDSFELAYSLTLNGILTDAPKFKVRPLFPIQTSVIQVVQPPSAPPKGVYIEGGVGPHFTGYSKPVVIGGVGGSIGIGFFNRSGWSYGIKGGVSQIGWSTEINVRKSFAL